MAAARRTRWVCPECGDGRLGPTKPRKNNVVRYCLPCSEKAGVLVERETPALTKRREAQAEAAKAKRVKREQRRKATEHARTHVTLWDAAGRIVEVNPDEAIREIAKRAGIRPPRFTWNRRKGGTSGRAWPGYRVHLSIGGRSLENFCSIAAHELAHFNIAGHHGHNDRWRDEYERICRVVWGVHPGYRGDVAHHRYAIDPVIQEKLEWHSKGEGVPRKWKKDKPLIGKQIGRWERREVECPACHGERRKPGADAPCGYCDATGQIKERVDVTDETANIVNST